MNKVVIDLIAKKFDTPWPVRIYKNKEFIN